MNRALCTTILATALLMPASAWSWEQGDWLLRFGSSQVDPKSNNHSLVKVDDNTGITFNITRMLSDRWSFEVLAAWPYEHDIALLDGTTVASTKHLPPTIGMQYHFKTEGSFQPYAGLGLNYTTFFNTKAFGALAGSNLKLDDSFGLAAQLGADIPINDDWFVNLNLRYIRIETDATLDGSDIGTVEIDPKVFGVHIGRRW